MKILLVAINSKYIHSNPAVFYLKRYAVMNSDDAEKYEQSIEIKEYTINSLTEKTVADIYETGADVVAFSCYIWNITVIRKVCTVLHKIMPETHLWLGGPEVSFDTDAQFAELPFIRGIMTGEGEESFLRLCRAYMAGNEALLERVLDSGHNLDFDKVPFPYDDPAGFDKRIVYYESGRGCPYGCAYCLSSVDRKVRLRSLSIVEKELQQFLDAKVPLVKFVDRTFNCNREHTIGVLKYIKEHDNGITGFHFEIAAQVLSEDEIELLRSLRPGQVQLEIGVQTANTEALKAINRSADTDRLEMIVGKLIDSANMHIHLDLIAGLPYENLESFKQSFNRVYGMHGHNLQLGFLKVLKGTLMHEKTAEYGLVYNDEPPYEVLSTKWLSYDDICELKGVEEALECYYNSRQFTNTIAYLEKHFESAYSLYYEISRYYRQNGLDKVEHSRYARYEHLRSWWLGLHPEDEDVFTQLLLHDLYLRENVKSRPSYGEKYLPEKEFVRAFFESGDYREYLPEYEAYSPSQAARMVHIEKTGEGYRLYNYKRISPIDGNAYATFIKAPSFVQRNQDSFKQ